MIERTAQQTTIAAAQLPLRSSARASAEDYNGPPVRAARLVNYFDLEDLVSLVRLEQPMTALPDRLVVIDEVQRRPELFPILRPVTAPCRPVSRRQRSPVLLRQSAERWPAG